MNTIKRDVYVLRNTIKIPIEVMKGTNMVGFEFTVRDYDIPATAAAVAYAYHRSMKKPNSMLCEITDNVIVFTPVSAFFEVGINELQIRVVNEDKSLISFKEKVKCSDAMGFPDDEEEKQQSLVEQLIAYSGKETAERTAADESERRARIAADESEKENRITAIENEKNERTVADAKEKSERQAEIDVERKRINNLTKLGEGSTTGDAELQDIRIGADGTSYDTAGEAVRGQAASLKEEIDDIAVKEYAEMQVEFIEGSYIPYFNQHTIIEDSNAKYLKISCKSGEKYKIHTKNFYDGRAYALYSGENECATDYYPGTKLTEVTEEIVIPEDVTTLVVNSELSFPAKVEKYVINNKNYYAEKKIMESEIMRNKHEREYFYSSCINLINSENLLPDKGVIFRVGRKYEIIDSPGYYALKSLIPVQEGETYTLLTKYARAVIYDFNLTVIDSKYEGADPVVFTIPTGGAFLSCFYQNSKPISGLYKGNRIGIDFISPNIFLGKTTSINGLNWCAFGDSLTDKNTLKDEESGTRNYVDFIQWSTGLNVTNLGKGGTGYMADNGYQQSFIDRISQIPTDSNIITCFGSFNDASKAKEHIGTIDDDTKDTLYGCLNLFVTGVQNHCPDSIIGLITPTPWSVYNNVNGDSEFSEQYVDAIINIAKKYGLPLLDLYHSSGLRPWDSAFKEKYFRDDTGDGTAEGVHPLQETHRKYIAPQVENFIRSIANTYISISY